MNTDDTFRTILADVRAARAELEDIGKRCHRLANRYYVLEERLLAVIDPLPPDVTKEQNP